MLSLYFAGGWSYTVPNRLPRKGKGARGRVRVIAPKTEVWLRRNAVLPQFRKENANPRFPGSGAVVLRSHPYEPLLPIYWLHISAVSLHCRNSLPHPWDALNKPRGAHDMVLVRQA